ncbi:HNH endonuclease [Paenibacillus lautus]|uniref:HNH endonuclease signature motif containing protein n=1 Tax=Paenibacillus lautus TaxID=1401 RepID=UPI003D2B9FE7
MKKIKWLLSVFMVLVLTLQILPGLSKVSADETSASVQYLGENNSDVGIEIPLEFVEEYNETENPNEVTERYYFITFNEDGTTQTEEVQKDQLSMHSVQPLGLNGVGVSVRNDPVAGQPKMSVTARIVTLTGTKPNKLDFKLQLGRSMTRSSTTSIISSVTYTLQGVLGVQVGKEVKHTFDISGTGFYTGVLDLTAKNLLGGVLGTDRSNTSTLLVNKKGVLYPPYTDPASGKVMTEPARADWARTTSIPWTSSDREKFKTWYNQTYPNNYDWSKNEVHHIRPRNLGGTNVNSNLMPIPTTFHRGTVSPWFVNY